ncbi:MAG TPA: hypothetical protein VN030_10760 [Cellvibrio sp.]|nr:hypothetical protein [Cellvibrio sp.]
MRGLRLWLTRPTDFCLPKTNKNLRVVNRYETDSPHFFLIISPYAISDSNGDTWVARPEGYFSGAEIAKNDIYEIVLSKESSDALRDLEDKPFIEINEKLAKLYAGNQFIKKANQHIYLIRAVNSNPGTGGYTIQYEGNTFYVSHSSLGGDGRVNKSALIINTEFRIEKLYMGYSRAM